MFQYWENALAAAKQKVAKCEQLRDNAQGGEWKRLHLEVMKARNEEIYFANKLEIEHSLANLQAS